MSSVVLPPPRKSAQEYRTEARKQDELDKAYQQSTTNAKETPGHFNTEDVEIWKLGTGNISERITTAIKEKTGLAELPTQIRVLINNLNKFTGETLNKGLDALRTLLNSNLEISRAINQKSLAATAN